MANKEKSQISPAAERPVAKDSIMSMDEKARKPLCDAAGIVGTLAAGRNTRLNEREEKLLRIIRESEDPAALILIALEAAADCLKQLEQSE